MNYLRVIRLLLLCPFIFAVGLAWSIPPGVTA